VLGPGTFILNTPLKITTPLSLLGTGADQTEIVFDGQTLSKEDQAPIIQFTGKGPLVIKDIALRNGTSKGIDLITVESGEIDLSNCYFTQDMNIGPWLSVAGLWLQNDSKGTVRDCAFEEAGMVGIRVEDEAQVVVERNLITSNNYGIAFSSGAGGIIRQCEISSQLVGIHISDQALPMLEDNVIAANGSGISYYDSAGGIARRNNLVQNWMMGIAVSDSAQPLLQENTCTTNKVGIYIFETADPTLEMNDCYNNTEFDIQDLRP